MKISDQFRGAGRPFSYYPNLTKVFGSLSAAIYFCCVVWRDRDMDCGEEAFIKTQQQICDESGLGFDQAKTAKALVVKLGVLECQYDRLKHRSFLKPNWEKLDELYEEWEAKQPKNSNEEHGANIPHAHGANPPRAHGGESTVVPCMEKKEENNTITEVVVSPPQTGEVSIKDERYLPFKYFLRNFPEHRRKNRQSVRAAEHKWGKLTPSEQRLLMEHLTCLVDSPDWLTENGKWVPNPDNFIEKREMWAVHARPNHKAEVEEAHRLFLEISGGLPRLNNLTPERREHISHRIDEALRMIEGTEITLPELIGASIKACVERHKERKMDTTIEHIFGTTENFERWTKKTVYA